ncbi:MAG: M48 family metallopeptidase [Comamonadaceae bacterium]|nr:M48 family metallopeptidase [Comamonadaceae bacterium]
MFVALPHGATAPQIRDAVQALADAPGSPRAVSIERLDHFAPRLGVRWKKLSLSNAGTRLGQRQRGMVRSA